MKRIVATFTDRDEVTAAKQALHDKDLEPEELGIDNPFFDPTAKMPEGRGLLWGGLIGGLIGAVMLIAVDQNVFWIPRLSPIMTVGRYELAFLGFGLGAASGGFLGGVIGTYREAPELDQPRVAVVVPDNRVREARDLLQTHGATTVDDTVSHHEHPQQAEVHDSGPAS